MVSSQTNSTSVAPALQALLTRSIDYAGLFPPAALSLGAVIANYDSYSRGQYAWMLRRLVVRAAELADVPGLPDDCLSVLGDRDIDRAGAIESTTLVEAQKPVYCEVPVRGLGQLDAVLKSGCFAKIRTGGVKAEAIPSCEEVAAFILACAERKLPFKATAGLHHPVRGSYPLTYEPQAPRAVMHGFLNVLMAAAFAWHGERDIQPILADTDGSAFRFDDRAAWRDNTLSFAEIEQARRDFMHSIGSCSFEEPVNELRQLGLLA